MRSKRGVAARLTWLACAILHVSLTALLPQRVLGQGGSLSGVVLPDLPPEISPGEEITFTPPSGAEGGTWTLSGVVAEAEEVPPAGPVGPPPLPTPIRVALRLPEGGAPWTPEHLVALAVAATGREGNWQRCFGNPGQPDRPAAEPPRAEGAKEIEGVDVIIRKKPKGTAALATGSQIAVSPLPSDYSSGAVREALGTGFAVRYFGVDAALAGCPVCKSFYESRSNRADRSEVAAYAIASPSGTLEVETAGLPAERNRDNGGNAGNAGNARGEGPSTVIAASITGLGDRGRVSQEGVTVVLAAARCEPAAMKSPPPGPRGEKPPGKPSLHFRVPETLKPGQPLSASYKDPAGNTLLETREVPGVRVVPARPRAENSKPTLTAAPELAIAGRPVCACGHFPDARSRAGLLFDEVAVSTLSASSRMALLPLAESTRVGRHVISGDPGAGFSAGDVVHTTVIQVAGKLDANQLRRGQGTQMELTVTGTDRPVAFKIVNKTPGIISIGGRAEAVLSSSGGSPNRLVQKVDSVGPGNFNIDFSLAADRCPCLTE